MDARLPHVIPALPFRHIPHPFRHSREGGNLASPRACAHEFSPHFAAFCCIVSIPVDGGRGGELLIDDC